MSFLFNGVTFRFNHIFQGCRFQKKSLGHILDACHRQKTKKYECHILESLIFDGEKDFSSWWFQPNPFKKICPSNWIMSQGSG